MTIKMNSLTRQLLLCNDKRNLKELIKARDPKELKAWADRAEADVKSGLLHPDFAGGLERRIPIARKAAAKSDFTQGE